MKILFLVFISLSSSRAGLLKIPKVYNALITSDQNLNPSRAFPVIQPVVHRTAVGYVPPFYYPQFAPQYVPEVIDLRQLEESKDKPKEDEKTKKEPPLKFYPNYQTVLYDPYFYAYSGLAPQVEQANYQQQMLDPIPPDVNDKYPERLLPHLHEDNSEKIVHSEKIPDVPPPPLSMGSPKKKTTS